MQQYSLAEYTDIHYVYGLADGNASLAKRLYTERFPGRHQPSHKVFTAVHSRLRESGSVTKRSHRSGRPITVRSLAFEEAVLQQIDDNPSTSTRAIAHNMDASKSTVWRTLHEQLLYPFKCQKVHELHAGDYAQRLEFSRWMLHKEVDSPNFLKNVLFCDETSFSREGTVNLKNNHVWAQENPHETVIHHHQVRFSVNVWAGIINDSLIGPYILPERLNGQTYLIFLQDVLPELLEDLPINIRRQMWFQHDGAPAHFSNEVRQHLNAVYNNQWVGRGGPVSWPPRSPDLTPLDFYLWGYMKQLVYATPVRDAMDLVARIVEAAAVIQERNGFEDVRRSALRRFRLCNQHRGGHIEHLL